MAVAPTRGPAVRELGLKLPPTQMPAWRGGRPLKRWRYVGVYTPRVMLCVGDARIGPVPQRWWAVALPGGELRERTTFGRGGVAVAGSGVRVEARGVRIELELDESPGIEIVSPIESSATGIGASVDRTGSSDHATRPYIWTRKQACVPVRGFVELEGTRLPVDGDGAFIDDSVSPSGRKGWSSCRSVWLRGPVQTQPWSLQ